MERTSGHDRLHTDPAANRVWYEAHGERAGGCDCAYCRNFMAALPLIPESVELFLTPLGLMLEKPAEILHWCREADGRHWYSVQFHLTGTLEKTADEPTEIAPGVTAVFLKTAGPRLRGFPEPFFQLFLDIRLPWVLEGPDESSKFLLQENVL